jgi:peptidoglycan/LPS O-acetylase OafA/YrhL
MVKFKKELIKFLVVAVLMALALVIFEGLSLVVVKYGLDHVRIISVAVGACGLFVAATGIRFVVSEEGRRLAFKAPPIVIGGALVCGAALYSVTGRVAAFVFCLLVPFVAGGVMAGIKAERNKPKQ